MAFKDKEFVLNLISYFISPFYFPLKWWRRQTLYLAKSQKILIIAYNHGIGTYILLSPMLKSLKANMPNCHICLLLSSKTVAEMAQRSDYIDEVILHEELPSLRMLEGIEYFKQIIAPKEFDLAISTIYETSSKNAFWAFFSGAPYRIGFNQKINGFLDTFSFGWDENTHEVQRYLNLLHFFGMNNLDDELTLPLSKCDEIFADIFFDSHGVSKRDTFLGVHPGAKKDWFQKIWPLDRFLEVASQFSSKFGAKAIFFGGPDEDEIFLKLSHSNHKFILADSQTIMQTAALIKRCSLFLTNDSGLMHLAAATKVPIVAIFGPTIVSKNRPWKVPCIVVRKELPCSPCYQYQKLKCKHSKCLDLITSEEVLSTLSELYKRVGNEL